MSEKFISSEALDSFFDKQIRLYENCPDKYDAAVELKGTSHLIPAADVRPVVRGKWKKEFRIIAGYGWYFCTCSRCGMTFKAFNSSNYCPNCGADMRPEEE